ncbi:zinc finger protein 862-like isoform X1 [Tachypleus tridentatus]|uniref:zinc finger protein 862-like isoform X1 n=1 Tax=Tachypleus tridentatus TaxID=6853 RepID=UPI003FD3F4F9
MFCSICQEYDQSSGKQKNTFITGSSNLRSSDVKEHENSHAHSLSCQAKTAKETPDLTPTMKELSILNQTEKDHLLVLFRTALYMALNVKPFSDFQELLLLQEHNFCMNLAEHYANDKQAVIFTKYIAETIRINVRSRLHTSLFYGIMTDGSTDVANIEQ